MATKFKPGIPEGFSLNIEPVRDLGDYLDEPPPSPRPQVRRKEPPPVEPVVAKEERGVTAPPVAVRPEVLIDTRPANVVEAVAPVVTPQPPVIAPEPVPRVQEERAARPKAPRREISMTPETLRMSDEMLEMIRSGSGQRDTKANELFHALVLLVYEAKGEIDFHAIPRRGRWGSPTARAYPLEIKNAFLQALLRKAQGSVG